MLFLLLSCGSEPVSYAIEKQEITTVKSDLNQIHKKLDCMTEIMVNDPSVECQTIIEEVKAKETVAQPKK